MGSRPCGPPSRRRRQARARHAGLAGKPGASASGRANQARRTAISSRSSRRWSTPPDSAHATGRDVRFAAVSVEEYTSALAEQGVPADVASLQTYLFMEVLDGRNAKLADGVQRALGREPGTSATTRGVQPRPASGPPDRSRDGDRILYAAAPAAAPRRAAAPR